MKFFEKIIYYMKLGESFKIARRYFIINAFDGALTMLGILFGTYLVGISNYRIILGAGLGATVAMGISGISGAYLSEKAEKIKKLKELERAMLKDLDESVMGKASKVVPIITALIDGFSPFLVSFIILIPFFFGSFFPIKEVFYASVILCFISMFTLGILLGKISKENMFIFGLKTLAVGIITALVLYLLRI